MYSLQLYCTCFELERVILIITNSRTMFLSCETYESMEEAVSRFTTIFPPLNMCSEKTYVDKYYYKLRELSSSSIKKAILNNSKGKE